MSFMLGIALVLYGVVVLGIAVWARTRIEDAADYVVAGRRLSLPLATATLFATWFGAGPMLAASDEVRTEGLRAAALDPFGAGICLLLAGWFFAAKLWDMKLLTLGDFYRRRFGQRAEVLFSILMVPGYFGWIAAQFVALAGIMELFFGMPLGIGIGAVAAVGMSYTLIGGMWSVTLTDWLQGLLLLLGLLVLSYVTLDNLGDGSFLAGADRLLEETPADMLAIVPTKNAHSFLVWLGVLSAGALGNLPGQDLMQRVFAARSATVAKRACLISGVAYLAVGMLPLVLALAGNILAPDQAERAILPFLAQFFLSPALTLIFVLAIVSAVLSTIDSAILSPATVMAQNLLVYLPQKRFSELGLNWISVVAVTAASLIVAYLGEDAYSLLEGAYEIGVVALLVPLALGLYWKRGDERAAIVSMCAGTSVWLLHLILGWEDFLNVVPFPNGLASTAIALLAYVVVSFLPRPP